jgi:hypothetical protein
MVFIFKILTFFLFVSLFYSSALFLNSHLSFLQYTHITTHTGVATTKYVCVLEVRGLNFGWSTGYLAEVLTFFLSSSSKMPEYLPDKTTIAY